MSAPLWGLLDTQDNVWLGGEDGPKTWSEYAIARCAHAVASIQLGWPGTRLRVEPFSGHGVKRDEVPTLMDTLTALKIAEGETPRRPRRKRKDGAA